MRHYEVALETAYAMDATGSDGGGIGHVPSPRTMQARWGSKGRVQELKVKRTWPQQVEVCTYMAEDGALRLMWKVKYAEPTLSQHCFGREADNIC
jgi:hypothetical protein